MTTYTQEPVAFGCHCDLEPGMKPDGCVLDEGRPDDCVYARMGNYALKKKEDCNYWKPIVMANLNAPISKEDMVKVLEALESNRVMSWSKESFAFNKEITPKIVLEAITIMQSAIEATK